MKKLNLKTISFVIALITLCAVFMNCSKEEKKDPVSSDKITTGDSADEFTIPEGTDYDGYEFRVLTWAPAGAEWQYCTFNITNAEETTSKISDACYKRNLAISDRINCTVSEDTSGNAVSLSALNSIVLSDPDTYDAVLLKDRYAFSAACQGLTVPYTNLPEVHLDKEWWYPTLNESLKINGKNYFAYGVHNLDTFNMMQLMIFNADAVEDRSYKNPYDLVKSGTWTMDEMYKMAIDYSTDVDNDNRMTADSDDLFGIVCSQETWYPNFGPINGHDIIVFDSNDHPVMNPLNDETLITIWQKVVEYENRKNIILVTGWDNMGSHQYSSNRYENAARFFAEDRALFLGTFISQIETVIKNSSSSLTYGIVPFPTYEEHEAGYQYLGYMYGAGNAFVIPQNVSDLSRTSVILETIAYESYKIVLPVLYEVNTLVKNAPDETARENLIMMNNNRVTDLSVAYWFDIGTVYLDVFKNKSTDFVSKYTANADKYQKIIDESIIKLEFNG